MSLNRAVRRLSYLRNVKVEFFVLYLISGGFLC